MSTFGPVYVMKVLPAWTGSSRNIPVSAVDGSSYRYPSYFYGVDTDDDYKPVVHVKYAAKGGPPLLIGGDVVPFCASTHNPGNPAASVPETVLAWRSYPGRALSIGMTTTYSGHKNYFKTVSRMTWLTIHWDKGWKRDALFSQTFDLPYSVDPDGNISGKMPTSVPGSARFDSAIYSYLIANRDGIHFQNRRFVGVSVIWAQRLCEAILDVWESMDWQTTSSEKIASLNPSTLTIADLTTPKGALVLGEDYIPDYGLPYRPSGVQPYLYAVNQARTRAFVDACESMPRLSDNSISNLSEILEFLLSVVRREPPKLPTALNELWLGYRYQYSTTKMDLKEAWTFVNRCYDLGSMFAEVGCHGIYAFDYQGLHVTCRCSFVAEPVARHIASDFSALWSAASQLGLAPDLLYLWDSTPFSFMVDWFLPVGDILNAVDASMLYNKANYRFGQIVYSLSYMNEHDGLPVKCYSRWVEDSSPTISPIYWLESRSASPRQVAYRALDAVSLVIGGAFN